MAGQEAGVCASHCLNLVAHDSPFRGIEPVGAAAAYTLYGHVHMLRQYADGDMALAHKAAQFCVFRAEAATDSTGILPLIPYQCCRSHFCLDDGVRFIMLQNTLWFTEMGHNIYDAWRLQSDLRSQHESLFFFRCQLQVSPSRNVGMIVRQQVAMERHSQDRTYPDVCHNGRNFASPAQSRLGTLSILAPIDGMIRVV